MGDEYDGEDFEKITGCCGKYYQANAWVMPAALLPAAPCLRPHSRIILQRRKDAFQPSQKEIKEPLPEGGAGVGSKLCVAKITNPIRPMAKGSFVSS